MNSNQIPAHYHGISGLGNYGTNGTSNSAGEIMWNYCKYHYTLSAKYTDPAGGSAPHNNIQPSIVMRAIIRLK